MAARVEDRVPLAVELALPAAREHEVAGDVDGLPVLLGEGDLDPCRGLVVAGQEGLQGRVVGGARARPADVLEVARPRAPRTRRGAGGPPPPAAGRGGRAARRPAGARPRSAPGDRSCSRAGSEPGRPRSRPARRSRSRSAAPAARTAAPAMPAISAVSEQGELGGREGEGAALGEGDLERQQRRQRGGDERGRRQPPLPERPGGARPRRGRGRRGGWPAGRRRRARPPGPGGRAAPPAGPRGRPRDRARR